MNAGLARLGSGLAWVLLLAACQPGHSPTAGMVGGAAGARPPRAATVSAGRAQSAVSDTARTDTPAASAGGIAWFPGSVEQALATARRERRPVMLFWGAQWCPFCHTLKASVFTRPDFIARTRLFIPVYLDGDDPGAQRWGERFAILGYPTLVLLDPDGHELLRLGAGRDVSEYAATLDVALQRVQPVDSLLLAAAGGRHLAADECRRLAYNSWELDTLEPGQYARRAAQLLAAAEACPAHAALERARLLVYAAGYAADAAAPAAPAASLRRLSDQVLGILQDPGLARTCAPALQNLDEPFFAAVRRRGPRAVRALRAGYVSTMDAAAADPSYVTADQLGFIDAKIVALKSLAPGQPLNPAVARAADRRIDAALAAEQSPYVRPGLVNAALNILEDSGQYQKAYVIAKDEISRSDTPYYYQADLAEVAEQLGHRREALHLLAEAYRGARGPATRFQWGKLYLSGLLRMAPQDGVRIEQVGLQVLGELDGNDRIADRARVRLGQLDQELRAWNSATHGAHAQVLGVLRARMQTECVRLPPQAPAHASCEAFLARAT